MLILLAAIINQKPIQSMRKHIRWESVLNVSDYQEIVNIVYVGLLGIEKNISDDCNEQFYQEYRRSLLLYEAYEKVEEVIKWQLERYNIEALFLLDSSAGEMYPKPEMAEIRQIEILVDKKELPRINRLMLDMDYEHREDSACSGILYVRVPGIRIVFYDTMPIENKVILRYFSGPLKRYRCIESYRCIHMLSNEEEYLYRVARMVELYITGKLKIRDILDLWQYRKLLGEKFRWKSVKELLDKADWEEFVNQVDILGTLWFGEDAEQQYGVALELEEYIITHGRENKHLDETLLPCEKIRLDFYWRNRDKEWALRKQAWMFPSREYMIQFFPILEKHPYLLVFCWTIRNWRFFRRICGNKCKKAGFRIRVRLLDIQEKMKGMISRNRDEEVELPEEIPGDIEPQAKEEGVFLDHAKEEESVTQDMAVEEEIEAQEAEPEKETVDTRNRDAEEDTANIEQTEGDSDV
ncbi:hypothetical protein IMSAGC018_00272 [Lachnospiraceae bacterium]|nr:hypothetical protein IMSAGC018_00272 [Lachnospiraceae bacterium]